MRSGGGRGCDSTLRPRFSLGLPVPGMYCLVSATRAGERAVHVERADVVEAATGDVAAASGVGVGMARELLRGDDVAAAVLPVEAHIVARGRGADRHAHACDALIVRRDEMRGVTVLVKGNARG